MSYGPLETLTLLEPLSGFEPETFRLQGGSLLCTTINLDAFPFTLIPCWRDFRVVYWFFLICERHIKMSSRIDREGYIHYDMVISGKRFCGNTGHRDKKQATIWIADFKAKVRREMANEIIGIMPEVTLTRQTILQEWLAHHSGKHARNVKADWENHILPKLRNVQAMKVTSGMVEEIRTAFLNSPCLTNTKGKVAEQIRVKIEKARLNGEKVLLKPLKRHSNAGANKVLRHLYFVFGWGVKTERIPRLPFRKLKELVEQEPVRTFLRPEQVRPFLAQLDSLGTGARAGDTFMSLIHSAELNGVEPFEYLLELLKHAEEVDREPARWMPWNYPAAATSG